MQMQEAPLPQLVGAGSASCHAGSKRLATLIAWRRCLHLAVFVIATGACASASAADLALQSLERFFEHVGSFEARFEQVLLDERSNVLEVSAGEVWIERPGKFRWNYAPPLEQEIVSDGEKIWLFDPDLEQVTVRNTGGALGRTPAMLLAGEARFDDEFIIRDLGESLDQAGLQWLELVPRDKEAQFTNVRIGFAGSTLQWLEFTDALGQITQIQMIDVKENPPLSPGRFTFTPPPGTDVVDDTGQ